MLSLGLQEALPLDRKTLEFSHLESYLNHAKDGYCLSSETSIQNIYRISRSEEIDRWIAGGYDVEGMKIKFVKDHRRLLWHGSRGCNFGGILSQGLRIAPRRLLLTEKPSEKASTQHIEPVSLPLIVIHGHHGRLDYSCYARHSLDTQHMFRGIMNTTLPTV